jgi:hypothetical protein
VNTEKFDMWLIIQKSNATKKKVFDCWARGEIKKNHRGIRINFKVCPTVKIWGIWGRSYIIVISESVIISKFP